MCLAPSFIKDSSHESIPEGMTDNSPPIYRWVKRSKSNNESRQGRKKIRRSIVHSVVSSRFLPPLTGLWTMLGRLPTVETVGYFRTSLRDEFPSLREISSAPISPPASSTLPLLHKVEEREKGRGGSFSYTRDVGFTETNIIRLASSPLPPQPPGGGGVGAAPARLC
jgi:hypothetical protein